MAIAPSPPLATTPVRKRRRIALTLLLACLGLFGLDALLFRTRLHDDNSGPCSATSERVHCEHCFRADWVHRFINARGRSRGSPFTSVGAIRPDPKFWLARVCQSDRKS